MTATTNSKNEDKQVDRELRYRSHALIEVRKYKHIPLFAVSGVLLDMSFSGFKLDLTKQADVKPGDRFWLQIPLATLGIFAPSKLICQGECRWYDPKRFRVGGVFLELNKTERLIVDQIIMTLEDKKKSE